MCLAKLTPKNRNVFTIKFKLFMANFLSQGRWWIWLLSPYSMYIFDAH